MTLPEALGPLAAWPRSNGGLALSTGRVFIPRVSGSAGQKVQHGAARTPVGRGGTRYASWPPAEPRQAHEPRSTLTLTGVPIALSSGYRLYIGTLQSILPGATALLASVLAAVFARKALLL